MPRFKFGQDDPTLPQKTQSSLAFGPTASQRDNTSLEEAHATTSQEEDDDLMGPEEDLQVAMMLLKEEEVQLTKDEVDVEIYLLPPHIDLQGRAKFPVFELHLQGYIDRFYALPDMFIAPTCKVQLQLQTSVEWQDEISADIFDNVKQLLSQPQAPSAAQIRQTLTPIGKSLLPGTYLGNVRSDADPAEFLYEGSATKPVGGLYSRTSSHLNKTYRERACANGRDLHLYKIIDAPGTNRNIIFFKTSESRFENATVEHVLHVRFKCILIEQILMSWFRAFKSYGPDTTELQKKFASFSPWYTTSYQGTNIASPLTQGVTAPKTKIPLTVDQWRSGAVSMVRVYEGQTLGAFLERSIEYHHRVVKPIKIFREAGATDAMVNHFKEKMKTEYTKNIPLPIIDRRNLSASVDPLAPMAMKVTKTRTSLTGGKTTKGKACKRCNRLHEKCDGKSPCARCTNAGRTCEPQVKGEVKSEA